MLTGRLAVFPASVGTIFDLIPNLLPFLSPYHFKTTDRAGFTRKIRFFDILWHFSPKIRDISHDFDVALKFNACNLGVVGRSECQSRLRK
jgi:hypothetical protein